MNSFIHYIRLWTFVLGVIVVGCCKAAILQGKAPSNVAVGEQFRLTYTIATHDVSDIRLGNIPDAFDVLIGPQTSTSSSFQMINGKTSSNESTTFTYILVANKTGKFTIPAAKALSGGRGISSNSLTINVDGEGRGASGSRGNARGTVPSGSRGNARGTVTGSELFITVSASRNRVCEQEPVLLTYKVYTQVELTALEGKMPDLKGFHTQEVTLPQQKSFSVETYKGKTYRTVVWSQYLMYPQVTGNLVIPGITFRGTVVMRDENVDAFEAFLNGGGYSEVNKNILAPSVNIHVDALPARPKNFSGGVGRFDMTASLSSNKVKCGEPLKLRVAVTGNGNLKLIKQPELNLPKDFDVYDPKVEDNTRLSSNGLEGNMTYEYLCVPRHKGNFTLPAIEFTYFDTSTRKYETKKTQPLKVTVVEGDGGSDSYTEQEALRLLNNDIRFIKTGGADGSNQSQADCGLGHCGFFLSGLFWGMISVAFLAFVVLVIIFRQRAIANADVVKMRGKRANKVAAKRLKIAGRLLEEGKNNEFYDEVLRALWGYVGDKLNINVEKLSKDNISEKFAGANVDSVLISQFTNVLDECEFARFAPGDKVGNMQKVYESAADVIGKIEDVIGKRGVTPLTRLTIWLLFLVVALPVNAMTKADGDSAYVHEEYAEAINIYETLLKQSKSADIYYNLGNAYYRDKDFTRAIINYERALLLDPSDEDIRWNLEMARTKTVDKIVPKGEMFFVTWYRAMVNMFSMDAWAVIAVIAFVLLLAGILVYLICSRTWMQKAGGYSSVLMLVVFIFSMVSAFHQKHQTEVRDSVIVTSPSVSVKSTPADNGTELFVIHEGTKAKIIDDSMKDWKEVIIDDGKRGWLETNQVERI